MTLFSRPFYEPGMQIDRFCRLCYNTCGYREPSGNIGKSRANSVPGSFLEEVFESKHGFGYEEWLDNDEAKASEIAGFSQGFIQRTRYSHADPSIHNVALWTKFAADETDEINASPYIADPFNPMPGSCWLVGFITHLSFVGNGSLATRCLALPFPKNVSDRLDPERRLCEFEPNIMYPDGCLRILPREDWVPAPRLIPHRYNWLSRENKDNEDLFKWAQSMFDEIGPEINAATSLRKKKSEASSSRTLKIGHRQRLVFESEYDEILAEIEKCCEDDPKTKKCLVAMRTHQADFRQGLILLTGGRCMVTGIDFEPLLIASHIKPFSLCKSTNTAYDIENGLFLAKNVDALFDAFLISFDAETGVLMKASAINDALLARFGIDPAATKLSERYLTERRSKHLKWHNQELIKRYGLG